MTDYPLRLLLAGGGTAGHVNPLLAVLEAMQARTDAASGPSIGPLWVGSERMESELVPAAGVAFRQIDIRFSYRWPTPGNWGYWQRNLLPLLGGKPFRQALAIVEEFQPSLIVASGGYVSAPSIWAALQRNVPVALLQLDDPPGQVNMHFADRAWRVLCSTSQVAAQFAGRCSPDRLAVVGYPALRPRQSRDELRQQFGIEPGRKLLVAFGGSLGAGAIHRAVAEFLEYAAVNPGPRWAELAVLQVGGERMELMERAGEDGASSAPTGIQHICTGYLADGPGALAAADFYFGRSGSATVGELIAVGTPALLMPDPQHADRQQFGNARTLVERGQGQLVEQASSGHGAQLAEWLQRVWKKPCLAGHIPPAAETAADALLLGGVPA